MKLYWAYLGVAVMAIAYTGLAILAHLYQRLVFDLPVTQFVQGFRDPVLDTLMTVTSWPGFAPQFVLFLAVILVGFALRKLWIEAAIMVGAVLAVGAMGFLVKPVVDRPRPPSSLVWVRHRITDDPYSFTAGHVHTQVVIYGWIMFLAITRLPRGSWARRLLVVLPAAYLVLVAISRVYVGDHWTSDVVGGALIGGAWLGVEVIVLRVIEARRKQHPRARRKVAA